MRMTEVHYKCQCMKEEVLLHIKERGLHEDIEDFMTRMQKIISQDHKSRSPLCFRDSMEYAKVEYNEETVGRAKGGTA